MTEHKLIPKAQNFGQGWLCERCELWFGSREIAASFECVEPSERARRRQSKKGLIG